MANITFNRKEFEKHIKITPEIIERIDMLGTPCKLTSDILEIEVFPNRPDLISMHGFLRALKSFIGKETGLKKYKIHSPEKNYKVKIDSSVKNIRPFTACAIVKNLKFDDEKIKEIIDIQEKIHNTLGRNRKKLAIGVYPLEKITLPIRYEARKPEDIKFIPLEMDQELNGLQILQRHPAGREYAHLLTNYDKYPVFVDAKGKILSMPPIINSHETGKITEKTKDLFIECSGFDFSILKKTLNILVTTLIEMGGNAYSLELSYDKKEITPNLDSEIMKISLDNANKLLGLNLKEKDLEKLFPRMGYDYKNGKVKIPSWRTDILHEVDLIEDLAIAYGYDKFTPEIPQVATIGQESAESKLQSKMSEILTGLGLLEVSSYHLIKEEEYKKSKLPNQDKIEVQDSKTEYKLLRPNLLIPALRIISENKDKEYPQKIFEIGHIFRKNGKTETTIDEPLVLSIAITPGNFTEIKQILNYIATALEIKYELKESIKNGLIEGRTGSIIMNNKEIGHIGEINPETLRSWNLKLPLIVLEINLSSFIKN